MQRLCKAVVQLGVVGCLPACGTIASMITYLIAYGIGFGSFSFTLRMAYVATMIAIAYATIPATLPVYARKDPRQIVIDELIGSLIALSLVNQQPLEFFVSFLLFRFFDITKYAGVARCEQLPGATGIILDDCLAGLFAAAITFLLFHLL
ncbi:MAG: phosphatidylglycerophosphatase A [Candidatus Babeliales bacterium]